jgi:hypothetical protein
MKIHHSGNPFPSEKHGLLLKAALLKGDDMLRAYRQWKALIDFEKDVEYASFRTLPLLYQNLQEHNIADELTPRLKGIYRQAWSKNQFLFFKTGKVLKFFEEQGIKTLVMKGIPLSILFYKNFAVRPMADMDLLIPFGDALPAVELLQNAGWKLYNPQYLEFNLKYGRSATFADSEKTELDLHWHPIFEAHGDISENDFWSKAIALEVAGTKTLSFDATDLFFHTIVHGLRYNPEPPIRWIADAMTILDSDDHQIDYNRLLQNTAKFRAVLYMKDAVNYLIHHFKAEFPETFVEGLLKMKVTRTEKFVFAHAQKYGDKQPKTFVEKINSVFAAYLRQTSRRNYFSQLMGFIKYLHFRNRGKPFLSILFYQASLLFKASKPLQSKATNQNQASK